MRVSESRRPPILRAAGRAVARAHDQIRRTARPVRKAFRIARHVLTYRAPGEMDHCPACGAPSPRPLMPIPIEGRARTYGFASGCERCGVVFANPLPDAGQVAAVYS